ncbi:COX15/CtaA family protein [Shewanella surugensis]|uniref:COX15/CtaA family protein n=1 Tax=Shewanella surugensis TaxID=212020 RepID=A0ABT0LGJ2_9GAMM|nr:COX15/CtaA family protein [Shewanella surugensis]MCL1126803.1 COX15/CtaA family protein [Shewanella surugensis]
MQISPLLKLTLVFTLCVILMGAYTRLSDAGLGCPDWPGCYGMIKVPTQAHELTQAQLTFPELTVESDKAWLEMIHRYIAGTLGLLVMWILFLCLKTSNAPKNLPLLISGLVLFQAALGMWTVTMKLMPIVVMSHLLGGFTIISLVLLLYLRTKPLTIIGGDPQAKKLATFSLLCLSVLVLQIILGGWTSANYAALACTALPICEGNWYQNLDIINAFSPWQGEHSSFEFGVLEYPARMTIHVAHRIWAIVTAIMLATLAYRLMKSARSSTLRQSAWILLILVGLQIGLGLSNVIFHLPLGIAAAHNAGAALLLLSLVFINYALWRKA